MVCGISTGFGYRGVDPGGVRSMGYVGSGVLGSRGVRGEEV